jgi:hypothetical protein
VFLSEIGQEKIRRLLTPPLEPEAGCSIGYDFRDDCGGCFFRMLFGLSKEMLLLIHPVFKSVVWNVQGLPL